MSGSHPVVPGPEGLWLHLRLLLCRAIWAMACKARGGESVGWQGVVAMVRAYVSRAIRQDKPGLAAGRCCSAWCGGAAVVAA